MPVFPIGIWACFFWVMREPTRYTLRKRFVMATHLRTTTIRQGLKKVPQWAYTDWEWGLRGDSECVVSSRHWMAT